MNKRLPSRSICFSVGPLEPCRPVFLLQSFHVWWWVGLWKSQNRQLCKTKTGQPVNCWFSDLDESSFWCANMLCAHVRSNCINGRLLTFLSQRLLRVWAWEKGVSCRLSCSTSLGDFLDALAPVQIEWWEAACRGFLRWPNRALYCRETRESPRIGPRFRESRH